MKKLLLVITLLTFTQGYSQTVDSLPRAIQVVPRVIDAIAKDTVYQMRIDRVWLTPYDTVSPGGSYVVLHDRVGKRVKDYNIDIPYSILKIWLNDDVIRDYILAFLGLVMR